MRQSRSKRPPSRAANGATRPKASGAEPGCVKLDEVIQAEMIEIVKRRREAGLPPRQKEAEAAAAEVREKLVGLALSGGGIRSASFCLGFLQTLYQTGLLRHVDYISSVSGGGYAAASLASEVMNPETNLAWEDAVGAPAERRAGAASSEPGYHLGRTGEAAHPGHRDGEGRAKRDGHGRGGAPRRPGPAASARFGLAQDEWERQPERVVRLVHDGAYLSRPRMFANRWLIGVVLIATVAAAGVLAAVSLAALLFRTLDGEGAARVIAALGFKGDIKRAFFPCALAAVAWLVAWTISFWRRGERAAGEAAQWLLLLTVALALMAFAALLGTGDIELVYLRDLFGLSPDTEKLGWISEYMKFLLPGLLGFSLLPYLMPRELIRSGVRPRNALEGWVFAIASRALLFGVPLLLFGWLAVENVSHHNEQRILDRYGARIPTLYSLVPADFPNWDQFWNRVELEAEDGDEAADPLSKRLWDAVNPREDGRSPKAETARASSDPRTRFVEDERAAWEEKLREEIAPPTTLDDELHRRWRETHAGDEKDRWPLVPPIELWRLVWGWQMELDRGLAFPERWGQALAFLLTHEQNDLVKVVLLDEYQYKIQKAICGYLTKTVVEDPATSELPKPHWNFSMRPISDEERRSRIELTQLRREGSRLRAAIGGLAITLPSASKAEAKGVGRPRSGSEPAVGGGPSDFEVWNARRWSYRRWLDDRTRRGVFSAWERKSEDVRKVEHALHDDVFAGNGRVLRLKGELDRLNWSILRAAYPDLLHDKATVFARVVQLEDQRTRLGWFLWSLGVFLVVGAVVNMNACSLHGFYKERLASMWIRPCPGMGREIPLALLETTSRGAPYNLFGATLNAMKLGAAVAKAPEDVFVFAHAYCGSERTGFVPTGSFARGRYDLASAVSLSGAALSPAYFQNPLLWSLMVMTNLRLGQWLPNPAHPRPARWRAVREAWGPVPLRLLTSLARSTGWSAGRAADLGATVGKPFFCYVTDGGYIENLGLEQLLLRRCRVVIACDASCDPAPDFGGLMDVARRARTEYGIHIHRYRPPSDADGEGLLTEEPAGDEDLDLQDLCPLLENERIPATAIANGRMFSRDHVVLARIVYPPGPLARAAAAEVDQAGPDAAQASDGPPIEEGLLIYVKPTLTGDEDADLIRFWGENPEFPHDSTMDQFYTPAKFESYRQLGAHTGRRVIRRLAGLGRRVIDGDLGEPAWRLLEFWAAEFGDRSGDGSKEAATPTGATEPAAASPSDARASGRKGRRSSTT